MQKQTVCDMLIEADTEGYVKIISSSESQQILGAQIVGPNAGEMISNAVLAMRSKITVDSIGETCHSHPVSIRRVMFRPFQRPSRKHA